jgi:hypothetical protein
VYLLGKPTGCATGLCKLQLQLACNRGTISEAACLAIIIASVSEQNNKTKKRKRKPGIWMKEWFKKRSDFSHENLLRELEMSSPLEYKNYLQMYPVTFGKLLEMVTPFIEKQATTMRDSTSLKQRLFATLRFLAPGLTFEDLKFETAIAAQALGKIFIETCEAIITVLKSSKKVII